MKRVLVASGFLMLLSVSAFAGKEERDYATGTMNPAVAKAEATYKSSCGCPLKITIDDKTIKSKDDMSSARYIAESVTEGAPGYCTDAASKKAVCQMKTLVIGKAKEATFSFKGGTGTATTDGQGNTTWEMMTRELDK